MNDMRIFPSGMGAGNASAPREERAAGERFDQAMDRALQRGPTAERQPSTARDGGSPREAQREAQREPARSAQPPRNDSDGSAARDARMDARSDARAQAGGRASDHRSAESQATAARGDGSTTEGDSARSAAPAADANAAHDAEGAAGDAASSRTGPDLAITYAHLLPSESQAAANAASAASSAAPAAAATAPFGAGSATAASDAALTTDTAEGGDASNAAAAGTVAQAGRRPQAAAKAAPADASTALVASDAAKGRFDPALPALGTEQARSGAVHDRLLEDFERRFERTLAAAVAGGREGFTPGTPQALAQAMQLAPSLGPTGHAHVSAVVGQPAFTDELSHRVLMFAGQRIDNAELSVTPADLGPIKVQIQVQGQEASLAFTASHAATRAAIEDALPRLREMFAAQGLQLTQAQVGDQQRQQSAPWRGGGHGDNGMGPMGGPERNGNGPVLGGPLAAPTVRSVRLIDIHV